MPSRRRTGCQTMPLEERDRVELVEAHDLPARLIARRSSSSTTGSIRSTRRRAPRGSRGPTRRGSVVGEVALEPEPGEPLAAAPRRARRRRRATPPRGVFPKSAREPEAAARAPRPGSRGRRRAGRRACPRARRSRRPARPRAAPPTAGRAGRRPPPAPPRGSATQPVGERPARATPSNASASAVDRLVRDEDVPLRGEARAR